MVKEILITALTKNGECTFYTNGTYLTPDSRHEEDFSYWKVEDGVFSFRHPDMETFYRQNESDVLAQQVLIELEMRKILEHT